ncbi:23S rRNA (pseudouridine(1915)-N(3))-methyltransferase RlmH [Nitratifractor sp.]
MKIEIYIIDKKGKRELYDPLIEHYRKLCRPWAQVEVHELFTKEIAKAQERSPAAAQAAYGAALERYRPGAYNIVLDPEGEALDSHRFAKLLEGHSSIRFYIGGAYGFERDFLRHSDKTVSFGKITLSHKLVKVVLMEQIFRGLTILNNHPYHK